MRRHARRPRRARRLPRPTTRGAPPRGRSGTEPIYYLVSEYSELNAYGPTFAEWLKSWYVRDQDRLAGLLTDFKFRHTPFSYPQPNLARIKHMKEAFLFIPPLSVVFCWALFTPL